ncbi:MAG: hypothetical protein GY871_04285 [Actinomycetales bacterium]|nr:hypothetical protein [Actinomycetales bacterium]
MSRFDIDQVVRLASRRFKPNVARTLELILRHSGFSWQTQIHKGLATAHLGNWVGVSRFTARAHLAILLDAGVLIIHNPERRPRSAYQYRFDLEALRRVPIRPATRAQLRAKRKAALAENQPTESAVDAAPLPTTDRVLNNHEAPLDEKPMKETEGTASGVGRGRWKQKPQPTLRKWLKIFYPGLKFQPGFIGKTWKQDWAGFDRNLAWWALTRACAAAMAKGAKHPEISLAWWILKAPTAKDWRNAAQLATKEGRAMADESPIPNRPTAAISAAQAAFERAKAKRRPKGKRRRAKKACPIAKATEATVAAINAAGIPTDRDVFAKHRGRYHDYYLRRRRAVQPGYRLGAAHRKKLDAAEDHLLRSRVPESFWPALFDEMERFWAFVTKNREGPATYPPPDMPCNNSWLESWIPDNQPPMRFTQESIVELLSTKPLLRRVTEKKVLLDMAADGVIERVTGAEETVMKYVLMRRNHAETRRASEWTYEVELAIEVLAENQWDLELAGGDR